MEQLLGPDHPQRARSHHLPHLLQQQVAGLVCCKHKEQEFLKNEVDKYKMRKYRPIKVSIPKLGVLSIVSK